MPKKPLAPAEIEIKWTEDGTSPGGQEPGKKLALALARELGRMAARRDHEAWEARHRDLEVKCRALSAACDELLASAIVPVSKVPKSDESR